MEAVIAYSRSPDGLVRCHFCGEEITKLQGIGKDHLACHSLDGDHKNWSPANKVPTHHACHSSHHAKTSEFRERMRKRMRDLSRKPNTVDVAVSMTPAFLERVTKHLVKIGEGNRSAWIRAAMISKLTREIDALRDPEETIY